jgi:hypothetical protein
MVTRYAEAAKNKPAISTTPAGRSTPKFYQKNSPGAAINHGGDPSIVPLRASLRLRQDRRG